MLFDPGRLYPQTENEERRFYLLAGVLLTLLAYLPIADNQFVNWDDTNYIRFNTHIRHFNLESIKWMFTHFYAGYWIPLTWFSYSLDFQMARLEPWIYHLDNLLLHLVNTSIVFILGFKLLGLIQRSGRQIFTGREKTWVAFGVSLLFGFHPLHVESVAWAAERKDLLCGFFYLLSLWGYLDWVGNPKKKWRYYASLTSFILALLSKPMAISLPLVLILADYRILGRFREGIQKILKEKLPFFAAGLIVSVVTIITQFQAGAGWGLGSSPLTFRLMNACHSTVFYLWKMIFPYGLAAFYPILLENTFSLDYIFSVSIAIVIGWVCWKYRQKASWIPAAFGYYLITLMPTLGLIQVGNQAAADRFTYLPSIGPFLLISGILVWSSRVWRPFLLILLVVGGGLLGLATYRQVLVWRDSISLWENVLAFYPNNNLIVHQNLGQAYEDAGRLNEALQKYNDATHPSFNFLQPHWGKGRVLTKLGRYDDAILEYKTALALDPSFPPIYLGLADVCTSMGSTQMAIENLQKAIELDPHYADAYEDLGEIYLNQGQWDKAIQSLRTACSLDPDNVGYLKSLEYSRNKKALASRFN